jgi:hypothetical protein
MALEAIEGVDELGGFPVVIMDDLRKRYPAKFNETGAMNYEWFEADIRPYHFVYVRKDKNSISFTLQKGPIGEVGVNGCQVDTVIHAAAAILRGFQSKFPCEENAAAIFHLENALIELEKRKKNREKRGVEGFNKA